MDNIRILDLGNVPALRSQAIYHAIAYAMKKDSPDTIVLVSPETPYACIGLHQELEKEIDIDYCKSIGLPVYRREVGGGAVYLDEGQVFVQWIFKKGTLPASVEARYESYIRPIVETYGTFGIRASHRPVNDIHVNGKKIGGTGAAEIGIADVVVGSFMFDFDKQAMSKILKVPSEKMRDKIFKSLEEYMTTMKEILGVTPPRSEVISVYLEKCREASGREYFSGKTTDAEEVMVHDIEKRFESQEWIGQKTRRKEDGIKIHEDVRLYESVYKAQGGLLRVTLRTRHDKIDDVTVSGDFTIFPADAVSEIERELVGVEPDEQSVVNAVSEVFEKSRVRSPGLTPSDIWKAVELAIRSSNP